MKILLANMPIEFNKRENLEPPLGICYLASMVKGMSGVDIRLKDYEVRPFSNDSLRADLDGIDVLGVSFRTASYRSAKQFVKMAKVVKKDIFVVAGGHHATAFPKETIADMECDAVIEGEGEYIFKGLVERLKAREDLDGLDGLVFRGGGSDIIANKKNKPIEDIDKIPWPARELLDLDDYNVMTILTSRGCPYNCIYCDKGISTRAVKFRSPDDIFDEMKHIVSKLGKKRLYVVDDHFFLSKKRLEGVLDRMIAERLPAKWVCQARVDGMTEDILLKAKEAGCEQIMYGVETGDETELKFIRKEATLEDTEKAVASTRKAGITVRANFMLGFPISTRQTIRNTINFAKTIRPDIVRFFAVSPLPNTDLWDYIYGKGRIPENIRWEDIDFYRPSFDIPGIPRDEISLYVSAAYWHCLKARLLKEATVYLIPGLMKLALAISVTGRLRGNISKAFPAMTNLLIDNLHQLHGKRPGEILSFLGRVRRLEKTL